MWWSTCVNVVVHAHVLQVVVASLLVLLQRAALLVTPSTISAFVGFANCYGRQEESHLNRQ